LGWRSLAHVTAVLTTAVIIGAGPAQAHARLVSPVPRTNDDDLKDGAGGAPCGGRARNPNAIATYTMGQTVTVRWEETINHAGCFTLKLSQANDQNFIMLANPPHSTTGAVPRQYQATITLPAGMTCTACTLQLIQVMSTTVPCPITNTPVGDSYYSCADVVIVAPDAGTGGTAGGSGGTAGGMGAAGGAAGGMSAAAGGMEAAAGGAETTMGGTGGGRETGTLQGGQFAEGGCSSAGPVSAVALLAVAAAALRLRRRR